MEASDGVGFLRGCAIFDLHNMSYRFHTASLHRAVLWLLVCIICWFPCCSVMCAQVGTLRFCGSTEFSGGLWAGVELDKPEGKNDGSVAGVQYFTCRMKHGRSGGWHLHVKSINSASAPWITFTFLDLRLESLYSEYFIYPFRWNRPLTCQWQNSHFLFRHLCSPLEDQQTVWKKQE